MLVEGLNTTEGDVRELGGFLSRLRPSTAFLGIPTRPPAEPWVRSPDERTLGRAFIAVAEKVERVEYLIGYEGNAFASTGDVEKDILNITAVHPMRKEAMDTLLSRAGAAWAVIDGMLRRGDLAAADYKGHTFYLRRFVKPVGRRPSDPGQE
jgi:wyosine [tRNA(Phe)-imidazoG37] synthetase (radical SAM superfamily)